MQARPFNLLMDGSNDGGSKQFPQAITENILDRQPWNMDPPHRIVMLVESIFYAGPYPIWTSIENGPRVHILLGSILYNFL